MKSITLFNRHFLFSAHYAADPVSWEPHAYITTVSLLPAQQLRQRGTRRLQREGVAEELRVQSGDLAHNKPSDYHSWWERSPHGSHMKEGLISQAGLGLLSRGELERKSEEPQQRRWAWTEHLHTTHQFNFPWATGVWSETCELCVVKWDTVRNRWCFYHLCYAQSYWADYEYMPFMALFTKLKQQKQGKKQSLRKKEY